MGVDEDFSLVLFYAYWNTEECWLTFQAKYLKVGSSNLMLYSAKLHLDFRGDS